MSAQYHTAHVRPSRGVAPFVRRLRHRLARNHRRRVRLEQHRVEHEAGRQPAERRALKVPAEAARRAYQKPELQELGQLSIDELRALSRYRAMNRVQRGIFWAALKHRKLSGFLLKWIMR